MADEFKKTGKCAPGGYKCPCCGPKPKDRPAFRRVVRHRLKERWRREMDNPDTMYTGPECTDSTIQLSLPYAPVQPGTLHIVLPLVKFTLTDRYTGEHEGTRGKMGDVLMGGKVVGKIFYDDGEIELNADLRYTYDGTPQ